jgi:hypothetical protein
VLAGVGALGGGGGCGTVLGRNPRFLNAFFDFFCLNAVFWTLVWLELPPGGTWGFLPFAIFACFFGMFVLI